MSAVGGAEPLYRLTTARPGSGAARSGLDGSGSVARLLMRFTAAGIVVVVLLPIGIAVVPRTEADQKGNRRGACIPPGSSAIAIKPFLVPGYWPTGPPWRIGRDDWGPRP